MRAEFLAAGIPAEILEGLDRAGFVIVPKEPLASMVEQAYWAAHAEKAEEVWREMVEHWEGGSSLLAVENLRAAIVHSRASDTQEIGS